MLAKNFFPFYLCMPIYFCRIGVVLRGCFSVAAYSKLLLLLLLFFLFLIRDSMYQTTSFSSLFMNWFHVDNKIGNAIVLVLSRKENSRKINTKIYENLQPKPIHITRYHISVHAKFTKNLFATFSCN